MKTRIAAVVLLAAHSLMAQKYDRENFLFNNTHIPERLIYDQVKSYGFNIQPVNAQYYSMDYNLAQSLAGGLSAYDRTDYNSAGLKINVRYGPMSVVEERTASRTVEEEVNKQKVKVTYYRRVLSFRFPLYYAAHNGNNNVMLFSKEYSSQNIRYIEGGEYRTEAEAFNSFERDRLTRAAADINQHCKQFMDGCNAYMRDAFDFYSQRLNLIIFKFKKWDRDDEYNAHVKSVMKTLETVTADEAPATYINRLQPDIDYFKQFEGQFKPDDKKEDILYFGNYYNLAAIYFCLDDFEKARYYLQKLDSSNKKENMTESLERLVTKTEARMKRHLLTLAHLNYNPVKDFRLEGKPYVSDAMSASETAARDISTGATEATDEVIFTDGQKKKGRVITENGVVKFIPADDPSKTQELNIMNTAAFSRDTVQYETAKSNNGQVVKNFYRVYYASAKIKLLQLLRADLTPAEGYLGVIRPGEDVVTFFYGFGIKKKIGNYFENCPAVEEKARDGDFGSAMDAKKLPKYLEMCRLYDESCK